MKKTKQAQKDFTFAQLPHNRTEVFVDCYKMRFGTLLCIGLIILAFSLPLLGAEIFTDIVGTSLYTRMLEGELTKDEFLSAMSSLRVFVALLDIPCWVVFSVGLSGITRIVRQLAWGEPVFFFNDFAQGVKESVGRFIAVFAICSVLNFVSVFFTNWLSELSIIAYAPMVLLIFVVLPVGLWMLAQSTVYNVGFKKAFSNGIAFYGKNILQTLGFIAVACLVSVLKLIAALIVKYVTFLVVIVVFTPAYALFLFLFCSSVFDRYINRENFPDYYDKGVYRMDSPLK